MNITQEVKQELITAMLRKASKRQAAATTKAAKALDKLWRQLFAKHIALVIPEVPQERWAPLIQAGVFTSLNSEIVLVTPRLNDKWKNTDSVLIGKVGAGYGSGSVQRNKEEAKWSLVRRAVAEEWGGFLNFTTKRTGSYDFSYSWKTSHADLPAIRGMNKIYHPDLPQEQRDQSLVPFSDAAYKLSLEVDRLMEAFMAVLNAAYAMYDDLTAILAPVRTLKQLQEQFPDAVKYLPSEFTTKVKNTKQVADPELVKRAQRLLAEGIPD